MKVEFCDGFDWGVVTEPFGEVVVTGRDVVVTGPAVSVAGTNVVGTAGATVSLQAPTDKGTVTTKAASTRS